MNPIIHSLDPSQSDFMIQSRDGIWSAPNRVPTEFFGSRSSTNLHLKIPTGPDLIKYRNDQISSTDSRTGIYNGKYIF